MNRKTGGRRFDLKAAIPVLLLAGLLLAILVGAGISWELTVQEMLDMQAEAVRHHTAALNDEIGRQLAILDGYSASFTWDNIDNHEDLLEKLDRCVKNTEFSLVCFAYPDGLLYRNDGAEVQVNHRYYFQQAMQGERVVEFLVNNAIDPISRIGMAVPVVLNGEIEGLLLGLYDKAGFQAFFEINFSKSNGLTYICDSSGKLILGTADAERFLEEHGLDIDGNSNLMDILENSAFSTGSKAQVEEHMRAGEGGLAAYEYDGAKRYTTYLPLGINDWYIVSVLHESQIYDEAIGITGTFYLIIFAAILAALLSIAYLFMRERRKARETRYMFEHDDLTGILTGKAFQEQVAARLRDIQPGEYCIIYLDIYKFKLINDMYGYAKGNELLKALAEELEKFTQSCGGLCGRISGDSFILFLPHREEIMREFGVKKYRKNRIVSLDLYLHYGVYVINDANVPVNLMVDAAQLAQTTVKGNYDNCVAYYDEKIKERLMKEQEVVTSMSSALENGEFTIYLQPQYNYRNGSICGAEALVRWNSPSKGLISPGAFIPIFEANGFIIRLDEYVWEQVCKLQRKWLDAGKRVFPISINVSRSDLLHGGVAEKLAGLIKKYGLTPELIRVEITESAYMDDPQKLISEITRLEESGFTVEMDDFGSGYSSLNMLKDVPFHVLKTDMKFMTSTGSASRKDRILGGIIRMAHEMGMFVIAEGVETKEQADYILNLDCEQMQGYYFSEPLSVEQYEQLLSQQDAAPVQNGRQL